MRILSGLLPGHVLQRTPQGASVIVHGESASDGPLFATITSGGTTLAGWEAQPVGISRGGRFTATLRGIPTGGPYVVTIRCGSDHAAIDEVFVGDLWLMAGQSNMEGVGNLADALEPHPLVRCFDMSRTWGLARDPLHHLEESPDAVHHGGRPQTPEEARRIKRERVKGAGLGVPFGIEMHRRTGVPQGLIATAHGGTSMTQWDPALRDQGGDSLYGSMLLSLRAVAQPVAGVLWYQGCSDVNPTDAPLYTGRMERLVAAVRADLGQPELPWAVVQIARVVGNLDQHYEWNLIQEQQRLLPTRIQHLDVIAGVDLDLDDVIHIAGHAYPTLALRLARIAARLVHGDPDEQPAIQPISARVVQRPNVPAAVEVRFRNVVGGLHASGRPVGFMVVDREHRPVDRVYKTVLEGDRAILELPNLGGPELRLMYGWGKNPICNIVDGRGLAVPVFGPLPIAGQPITSPWIRTWQVSAIRDGEDIATLSEPRPEGFAPLERRTWTLGAMANCHEQWQGRSGHVGFFTEIEFGEDISGELLAGYDGPFRLWYDGRELVTDLAGTNPAIMDGKRVPLQMTRGRHRITVLMALNRGNAWGFFLRFGRPGETTGDEARDRFPLVIP